MALLLVAEMVVSMEYYLVGQMAFGLVVTMAALTVVYWAVWKAS